MNAAIDTLPNLLDLPDKTEEKTARGIFKITDPGFHKNQTA
jgi:hypothetical protein